VRLGKSDKGGVGITERKSKGVAAGSFLLMPACSWGSGTLGEERKEHHYKHDPEERTCTELEKKKREKGREASAASAS